MIKTESFAINILIGVFICSILLALYTPKSSHSSTKADLLNNHPKIGVININGPISFSMTESPFNNTGSESILSDIQYFKENHKKIKALLIRINSPGGTVGASQEIYQSLKSFKSTCKIPIIVSIADVGASGAYYIAAAGDHIFANPGSLIGSIGVIMGNINIAKFADKHGLSYQVYKSGPYKDMLSMWKDPNQEESQILQAVVKNVHQQFVEVVSQERKLSIKQVKTLATGRIFTGKQALNEQLIDSLGTMEDSITYIKTLTKINERPILITHPKSGIHHMLNYWKQELSFNIPKQLSAPILNIY